MRRSHVLAAMLLLTVIAAPPRLLNLNALGFYADEETTAFPARALAEGGGMVMPSGMPYLRAAPLTWLNAASARLFGVEAEASYRLPTALIGTLTVPVFFLAGARLVGPAAALVAALLLAGSEWHILFSRQARMYATMLGFAIAAAAAILAWAEHGRRRELLLALALFGVAISLHVLAAFVLLFALLPLVYSEATPPRPVSLVAFSALASIGTLAYLHLVETAGFRVGDFAGTLAEPGASLVQTWLAAAATVPTWRWPLALAGAAAGAWLAASAQRALPEPIQGARRLAHLASATTAGALAGAGHLYGAGLAGLVFLLLDPAAARRTVAAAAVPFVALGAVALASAAGAAAELGLAEGVKSLLRFPFPYFVPLARQSYGVAALFWAAAMWMALAPERPEHRGMRMCVIAVVVGMAGIGAARAWGGTRFLLPLYPFYLLAAAGALVAGSRWVVVRAGALRSVAPSRRAAMPMAPAEGSATTTGEGATNRPGGRARLAVGSTIARATPIGLGLASLIAVSGIVGGHGAPQAIRTATLQHGEPVQATMHMVPFRPDHAAPGRFVAERRRPGDVVIAEDPLQQRWYAGPVDYWLRSFADGRKFVYRAPDGALRDVYVNSQILGDVAVVDSLLAHAKGRIWLITSGETYAERDYYLDEAQRRWLDSLEATLAPAFTGRDDVTRVYCLNCSSGAPARSDGGAPPPPAEAPVPNGTR